MWYPDRTKATERDPPLYLHIAGPSQEAIQSAVDKINDLMSVDLGPLVEDKKDRLREKASHIFETSGRGLSHFRENGRKRNCPSDWRVCGTSMFVPKLLAPKVPS